MEIGLVYYTQVENLCKGTRGLELRFASSYVIAEINFSRLRIYSSFFVVHGCVIFTGDNLPRLAVQQLRIASQL